MGPIFYLLRVSTLDTVYPLETQMICSGTIAGMVKENVRTVPVHARIAEADIAVVDRVATEERSSRSKIIARLVAEWARQQASPKKRK